MQTLILKDIELTDNLENDNTFDIFFNKETNTFKAVENDGLRVFTYKPKDTIENITKNNREQILDYVIGKYTEKDVVSLGDIFLHGGFITKI